MRKIFIIAIIAMFLTYPATAGADCRKAESKTPPLTIQKVAPNTYHYNYDIQAVQKDPDGDGIFETFYEYCYVKIQGKLTKRKILEAIENVESSDFTTVIEGIEAERDVAKDKLLQISQMSYAQINAHINSTFGNLNTAQKNSLKKLYKAVLGMLKMLDLEN